ncbi:MAG: 4-hydroxythreonine-4-phosphate dehydrogenase PdxA [Planctomycetota bacterium]
MSRFTKSKSRSIIAITMGDAAGVGPELCLRLLALKKLPGDAVPLIIGDGELLARVSKAAKIPFRAPRFTVLPKMLDQPAVFDPFSALAGLTVEPGQNQLICGHAAARYIETAARGCLDRRFAAMVTAPISKAALNLAGIHYPGHTEWLAHLTRAPSHAMLFYSPRMACAFVTCHQSLRSVPKAVTQTRVIEVATLAWNAIFALNGKPPRLALLGLNPHAGENGLFGHEENRVLLPAKAALLERGIQIEGPLSPDTAFSPQARRRYDCYIVMYHDQGCIPFKMLAFDSGVNITLGLPIIRTSPDHGTAFDIAWQGKARPDSFFAAYELAARLASDMHPPKDTLRFPGFLF